MTATYKSTYTKPSLNDLWHFEDKLGIEEQKTIEEEEGQYQGYISTKWLESITHEEIATRKLELKTIRPDLYSMLFESITESEDTLFNILKQHNKFPKFNPFTTTHTTIIEFDTWDNLIFSYEDLVAKNEPKTMLAKNKLTNYNVTQIEEFYLDDVKQEYVGKLST
jgi:hypothetical protein